MIQHPLLAAVALAMTVALSLFTVAQEVPQTPVRATGATSTDPGEALYNSRCAACHTGEGKAAGPHLTALRRMSTGQVQFALTRGKMRAHTRGLEREQFGQLISYVTGGANAQYTPDIAAMCAEQSISTEAAPVASWGLDERNSRLATSSLINVDNVDTLNLAWAFGLPGTADARSHPVVTRDTVFVLSVSGSVFALDRASGCIKWHITIGVPLRTAITLGTAQGQPTLFFGDMSTQVYAVAAATGEVIWKKRVGLFDASTLTGAQVQHGTTLFVPVSAFGVALASNPQYECCKSHGAVRALNADSGEVLWTTRMTDTARPTYKNSVGVQQWGPSGAPVWSTPTIDAKRGRIYVGTGENTSTPATDLSDSIVALDMKTGKIIWSYQGTTKDAFNMACGYPKNGPNCPREEGPDFDFGAAAVLASLPNGKDIIVAGQKSGMVHGLDPETGKLLWQTRVGSGSALGGIHWGIAVSGQTVIAPNADPDYPRPGYTPTPGVYALDLANGDLLWSHKAERGCHGDFNAWRTRQEPWPECSYVYAFSAAPTVTTDLAFAASLNGYVWAFDLASGKVRWKYHTVSEFNTVNAVAAHGGSIDNAGVQIAGDMLFVQSGYSMFGQMPGNALLAFRLTSNTPEPPGSLVVH